MTQDNIIEHDAPTEGEMEYHRNGQIDPRRLEEVMVRQDTGFGNSNPADALFEFPTDPELWPVRGVMDEEEIAAILEIRSVDLALGEDTDWGEITQLYTSLKVSIGARGREDYKEAITGMRMVQSVENVYQKMSNAIKDGK